MNRNWKQIWIRFAMVLMLAVVMLLVLIPAGMSMQV